MSASFRTALRCDDATGLARLADGGVPGASEIMMLRALGRGRTA
jgi:hypothetical protein